MKWESFWFQFLNWFKLNHSTITIRIKRRWNKFNGIRNKGLSASVCVCVYECVVCNRWVFYADDSVQEKFPIHEPKEMFAKQNPNIKKTNHELVNRSQTRKLLNREIELFVKFIMTIWLWNRDHKKKYCMDCVCVCVCMFHFLFSRWIGKLYWNKWYAMSTSWFNFTHSGSSTLWCSFLFHL